MHAGAHAFLGVGGPVFAIEANEDGGIGDGHRRFQDEDMEFLAGFVDLVDDALVQHRFDGVVGEQLLDLFAIGGDAGSIIVGDEGEFLVHVDERADVDGVVDGAENIAEDVKVGGVGLDGFYAGRGLKGIGGIDDEDPVAVSEEGDGLVDASVPVGLGYEERWRTKHEESHETKVNAAH